MTDLEKITPPKELSADEKRTVFEHFLRQLARFRNTHEIYALTECDLSKLAIDVKEKERDQILKALNQWAQDLVKNAWAACGQSGDENPEMCPVINQYTDTSSVGLRPMPPEEAVNKIFTTILFLHITTAKQYSAYARLFLNHFQPSVDVDEQTIVRTLKNPERVISEAQAHAEQARMSHANEGRIMRMVGVGVGAVAGGILIGVTGGLAAPVVGAGVTSVLTWFGVGGTAVGLLASGLAGSSLVCGALFGAYGANSTGKMIERHTREVRDLAVLPVKLNQGEESLGVRLCVSGWLTDESDVRAPWTSFEGDDTFALQWEIDALRELSDALYTLIKSHAMKYAKVAIIRQTVFAGLMSAMSPVVLLKVGQIIDNPWMNARALAIKTGAVLGDLLARRAFGNRPITLVGYSLGSLAIFEALRYLGNLPVSESFGLVQDVFLFGTPASAEPQIWAKVRRVVAGRVVNGYASDDYVLAVLSRASDVNWRVAGLGPVGVQGVENMHCKEVTGHTMWREMVGKYLEECNAPGIVKGGDREVDRGSAAQDETKRY
ncbi:DUF726-domain-containing protein [Macrolepiota fuliginosa MF-IS2]|uniref:DUF726-domain-containing protein n=1 Tax=Macrolepiota fuliginosa MF-IS2 TaxID=1400762 RepID=A0A9P5XNJ6_9AGAR|nr:DUF726-domain-containing protein [Macrolepiota fuliginosa MF-IS2]